MTRIRQGGFGTGRITPPAVNLARNPWPVDLAGIGFSGAPAGSASSIVATGGPFGGPFVRLTWGGASTTANVDMLMFGDPSWVAGSGTALAGAIPVRPGDMHTWSVYVRSSRPNPVFAQLQYLQGGAGASGTASGSPVSTSTSWIRVSVTGTAGADAQAVRCDLDLSTPVSWLTGDTIDFACLMISQGPDLLPFSVGSRREV